MADVIHLAGYRFRARAGVEEYETSRLQPFELDLFVETDLSRGARSGRMEDTLDYGGLAHWLEGHCQGAEFSLLEELAEDVAQGVLEDFPAARAVRVVLKKLQPPYMPDFHYAAVEIERRRQ